MATDNSTTVLYIWAPALLSTRWNISPIDTRPEQNYHLQHVYTGIFVHWRRMQRFTATCRPYNAPTKSDKHANTMNSIAVAESWGRGPANLLPRRYDDNSLISVPALRPEDVGKVEGHKKEKKSFFSSRRKSENSKFVMKQIPRGEYLAHYAKDDDGKYIGTEEPHEC